ncbi:MAG: RnfABCDGE type electron transport complex subunit D [Oscillospiraceae bacterium]|nr:RnfABCDGE type electron transport complex subunit D [Oscillospiraceae bacterium]
MENNLIVTSSPHITDNSSTRKLMGQVILALVPAFAASVLIFGTDALLLTGVTTAACVGFEFLYCLLMKKEQTVGDLSAVVTGLLLAFNLPSTLPLWIALIGAFIAIVVVKQLFGGIGCNFANPAIVARIVLAASFTGRMTKYAFPSSYAGVDALAGATPLAADLQAGNVPFLDLLLGTHGGVLGETCALALILGGVYLIVTKVISPVIPCVYLGGYFILHFLYQFFSTFTPGATFMQNFIYAVNYSGDFAQLAAAQLLSGGILLGAFFMATDYVTSPFTVKGKWVFGIGLAIITFAIRVFGTSAEGVSFAILFMNLLVPYINNLTRQKPLGGKK